MSVSPARAWCCALLTASTLLLVPPLQAALPSGFAAEILDVQGTGERRTAQDSVWLPAHTRDGLPRGAFVRTGGASKMALVFADETQVRLNQNSILQVKEVASGEQEATTLRLELGRAWSQTRRAPNGLQLETPAATASIRGTAWELEVDGGGNATLAVLAGSVEFFNAQGRVIVTANEGALAEVGKAPVKILLGNPRDRVQWVNALRFDTRRYASAAAASPVLKSALAAIDRGDGARGREILEAERRRGGGDIAVYSALGELEIVDGNLGRAMAVLREGLAHSPRDPELLARLVYAQLLDDRVDAAKETLAQPHDAETVSILVATGETARREGRAQETLVDFTRATRVDARDDRGWFALGSAQNEREDVTPARRNLLEALRLNPNGPGYEGELGTLETFANRFDAAEKAFAASLDANPGDYVALTGLGLLRLKQGRPQEALDALLRAGVMEPRYARAKTFTAVAYYQLGRHADAIATLRQASELDDKDPLPYLLLSQIYTDLFRGGDAVQASREALLRLPYLKSLNQVANNQQGRANLGFAMAFFGLEEWALELAQASYYAYSGASHLFLADRYAGEFNKNSELFQGFLTDPIAFGGSNRFSTLVPTAGNYGTLGETYAYSSEQRLSNPYLRLNGVFDLFTRGAYYADVERGVGTVKIASVDPDGNAIETKADRRVDLYALGVGSLLTERLGLFGYATKIRQSVILRNLTATEGSENKERADVGLSYRFSPTSMTWVKYGRTNEREAFDRYFLPNPAATAAFGANSSFSSRPDDLQARHTLDLTPADHLAVGAEAARDRRAGNFFAGSVSPTVSIGVLDNQELEVKSRQAYASYVREVAPALSLEGALFWQQFEQHVDDFQAALVIVNGMSNSSMQRTLANAKDTRWNPRFGVVYRPGNVTIRATWQQWTQPASVSTLAPVATAGIALDDRLVATGGNVKRGALRVHWEPDSVTALSGFLDYEKVRNLGQAGFRIPRPQIEFVDLLRNAQILNVASLDLLEGIPDFDKGRVESVGVTVNRILSPEFSVAARYVHTRNDADIFIKNDAGEIVSSGAAAQIPFVPRRLFATGITWISPQRIYFSAQAVYRSQRFTDRNNTESAALRADWNGQVAAFWETPDKRWIVAAGAVNLGSKGAKQTYLADVRYRF